MKRIVLAGLLGVTLAGAAGAAEPAPKGGEGKQVARGKYLVESVGMCADCHSPRNERGEFVKGQGLWGAPLGFKNTVPMPRWAQVAPPIAGLPAGWTEQQAIVFLSTGKAPDGKPADPPMPEYRMSKEDATAVVAYLRSLPAPPAK
jgi:mono/diheme cytochrome c family protein